CPAVSQLAGKSGDRWAGSGISSWTAAALHSGSDGLMRQEHTSNGNGHVNPRLAALECLLTAESPSEVRSLADFLENPPIPAPSPTRLATAALAPEIPPDADTAHPWRKPPKSPPLGCALLPIPKRTARILEEFIANIARNDVAKPHEHPLHITLAWGLTTEDANDVWQVLRDERPIRAILRAAAVFTEQETGEGYEVL